MNTPIKDTASYVAGAIHKQILKDAERIYDEEMESAIERLRTRIAEDKERAVAAVAVRIAKGFEIRDMTDHITIRIETAEIKVKE